MYKRQGFFPPQVGPETYDIIPYSDSFVKTKLIQQELFLNTFESARNDFNAIPLLNFIVEDEIYSLRYSSLDFITSGGPLLTGTFENDPVTGKLVTISESKVYESDASQERYRNGSELRSMEISYDESVDTQITVSPELRAILDSSFNEAFLSAQSTSFKEAIDEPCLLYTSPSPRE